MDANIVVMALLRWIHILFGIIWIGHLYFFNFVNVNFEKSLDATMKKPIIPQLRPRALWWFRWGAMITMFSGVLLILWEQFLTGDTPPAFAGWLSTGNNYWITMGMLFGLIMWFNVWFIIWPNQRIILTGISTGNKPADFDARVATAGKFSRINTYLSVPMIFGMLGRQHFAIPDIAGTPLSDGSIPRHPNYLPLFVTMAVVIAIGFAVAYHFIHMVGPKVGKEFLPPAAPPPAPPAAPK